MAVNFFEKLDVPKRAESLPFFQPPTLESQARLHLGDGLVEEIAG